MRPSITDLSPRHRSPSTLTHWRYCRPAGLGAIPTDILPPHNYCKVTMAAIYPHLRPTLQSN